MAEMQRSTVGDVIQPGQPIPDDVTGVEDRDGDPLVLNAIGHWHAPDVADPSDCLTDGGVCGVQPLVWAPLTVTAVREQPVEPERKLIGPAHAHLDAPCTDACYEPPGARDADGFLRLKGTATGDNQLDPEPEPQQADEPALLDLVRQYGAQIANRVEAIENHSDESPFEHAAEDLFARIAALVPQQPVQAHSATNSLLWVHTCGWTRSWDVQPYEDDCPSCSNSSPGPWLPLLVGGDPAPEPCCNEMIVLGKSTNWCDCDAGRGAEHRVDHPGACKWKAHERIDHPDPITGVTVRTLRGYREAIGLPPAQSVRSCRSCGCTDDHACPEGCWWVAADLCSSCAAKPDPLVLRLPEVPEGTVALTGIASGRRYARDDAPGDGGEPGWFEGNIGGTLGEVLDGEPEGVRVELAPPREPRTAAEIWAGLEQYERNGVESTAGPELTEALDREAGL